ncbi:MAG TPA: FAD:protein FMN transferase, partial [Geminicoccaceae bacterium]|nr:FAD:protein FMN transferase [Geminicoccaceae bacterium]
MTRPGERPSRRRFLAITAATAGLGLAGALVPGRGRARVVHEWTGQALGAESRLLLAHPDAAAARRVLERCLQEIWRLERIFSLHLAESELRRLNRDGRLGAASQDLRLLLAEAGRFGALTGGAFDVTVQPLWRLYADHFAAHPGSPSGPPRRALEAARALVDHRAIDVEGAGVRFARPGMAATLNGIAQGYITDRAALLLREAGFPHVLVQLGETFAGAAPEEGAPWRVGVADPGRPGRLLTALTAENAAIATSSGRALRFDRAGRHHHLLDP